MHALAEMCAEHAAYESGETELGGEGIQRLEQALFAPSPRAWCWIAEVGQPLGYACATLEFSTWRAREFMHMDCLYVREGHRGDGIGRQLFEAVRNEAVRHGLSEMQWQTPEWNVRAAAFYGRLGASESAKRRFRYRIS